MSTMCLSRNFRKTVLFSDKNGCHGKYGRHLEIILNNMDMEDEHKISGLFFMYVLDRPLMPFGFIF